MVTMADRYCTHCGSEVSLGESHCMECGKRLPDTPPPVHEPEIQHSVNQPIITPPFQQNDMDQPPIQDQNFNSNYTGRFGQFQPDPSHGYNQRYIKSQPFIVYLLGLIFIKKETLEMEFNSNKSKNSILLLIMFLIFNYIIYMAFFSLYPINLSENAIKEIIDQNFFDAGSSANLNSMFPTIFAISGLFMYPLTNIILGIIFLVLLFNSNKISSPYKKGLIFSVCTLLPIIGIEIIRYIAEFILTQNQVIEITQIVSLNDLLLYFNIIHNNDLNHFPELRLILLVIRIVWTWLLIQKLILSSGFRKEKVLSYSVLFTIFAGGGIDLVTQIVYLL